MRTKQRLPINPEKTAIYRGIETVLQDESGKWGKKIRPHEKKNG